LNLNVLNLSTFKDLTRGNPGLCLAWSKNLQCSE